MNRNITPVPVEVQLVKNTHIELLEKVLSGELDATQALALWPDIDTESDPAVVVAWHDLSHFSADADIREKDRAYEAYQVRILGAHLVALRESKV